MKELIRQFEVNNVGRDFAIGDLHGCFDIFLNLLENLEFDPEVDRMFSVGDLVDRGPDSLACLGLLREPWFYSVFANHEQMMLDAYDGKYMGQYWFPNGGLWGVDTYADWAKGQEDPNHVLLDSTKSFLELLEMVRELPLLITVNLKDDKKVHIIHAEFPPYQSLSDEILADPESLKRFSTFKSDGGEYVLWGRYKFYTVCMEDLSNVSKMARRVLQDAGPDPKHQNLSPIISGHTKVQRPLCIHGQTNIDTAAYESYSNGYGSKKRNWAALTCVELNTWKFFQATKDTFEEVEPLVMSEELLNTKTTGEQNVE